MNIVSLFSGAGGLDLGLRMAGNHLVWANDFDKNLTFGRDGCPSADGAVGERVPSLIAAC